MRWFMKLGIWKKTLVILMGIFFTAFVLCGVTSIYVYQNMEISAVKEIVDRVSEEKEEELQKYFKEVDNVAYNVGYSSWMQKIFVSEISKERLHSSIEEIKENMSSLSFLYADIRFAVMTLNDIKFAGNGFQYFNYQFKIEDQEWYDEFMEKGKYLLIGGDQDVYTKKDSDCITAFYTINNYSTLDLAGYLIVTIPMKNMESILHNTSASGYYSSLIYNNDNDMIGSVPQTILDGIDIDGLGEEITEAGMNKIYASKRIISLENQKCKILAVMDRGKLEAPSQKIWLIYLAVLFMVALLLGMIAIAISKYLTQPILNCKNAMLEIKNNHLGVTIKNRYYDEIGELIEGFNEMSGSIHDLIETNKNISILQKEAEYKMLERQISPHFLFNTLELINGLILDHKQKEAVLICENMGLLYQYNLKQEKWITFQEELEYTKQYLFIMKYKIGSLETVYEIDERILHIKILKAILQPLVENCIRHGFKNRKKECCITVSAVRQQNKIYLAVMDNGCGMTEEQKSYLEQEIYNIRINPGKRLPEASHIGVKNVFQRLYLEFGENLEFTIMAKANYGAKIQIVIPGGEAADV